MVYYTFLGEKISHSEQHDAAHRLLEKALKIHCGIENFSLVFGEKGKPYLAEYPDVFFNLSHCEGLAVCCVSDAETGVDAELIRPRREGAARRVFTEKEREFVNESGDPDEMFFRIWTLKESLGKMRGTGILSGLINDEFVFRDGVPVCLSEPKKIFTQHIIEKKWVVSVCSDREHQLRPIE